MAVPKQHDSKGKVGKRQSQKNVEKKNISPCPNCRAPRLSHRICDNCGFYKSQEKGSSESE
ncbi:MAG: 50S ribosomal protein L32 [Candidatus Magasanikbacteria bacterium]